MGSHTKKLVLPRDHKPATADQQFERLCKMKAFLVFAFAASATAQLKFGSDSTEAPKKDERLHPGQQRPDPDRQSSKWRGVHRQLQPVLLRSPERAVRRPPWS